MESVHGVGKKLEDHFDSRNALCGNLQWNFFSPALINWANEFTTSIWHSGKFLVNISQINAKALLDCDLWKYCPTRSNYFPEQDLPVGKLAVLPVTSYEPLHNTANRLTDLVRYARNPWVHAWIYEALQPHHYRSRRECICRGRRADNSTSILWNQVPRNLLHLR